MAACARCGSETELFFGGVPICLKCADKIDRHGPAGAEAPEKPPGAIEKPVDRAQY